MTIPYKAWGDVEKLFEISWRCYSVDHACSLVHGQKPAIVKFTMYLTGFHDMVMLCILIENHHYRRHQTGIFQPFYFYSFFPLKLLRNKKWLNLVGCWGFFGYFTAHLHIYNEGSDGLFLKLSNLLSPPVTNSFFYKIWIHSKKLIFSGNTRIIKRSCKNSID